MTITRGFFSDAADELHGPMNASGREAAASTGDSQLSGMASSGANNGKYG